MAKNKVLDRYYEEVSKKRLFDHKEEAECGRRIRHAQEDILNYIRNRDPDFVERFDQGRHHKSSTPLVANAGDLALAYLDKIQSYQTSQTASPTENKVPGSSDAETASRDIQKRYSVFVSERNKMVEANLRLVIKSSIKYFRNLNLAGRYDPPSLQLIDLINEGNIGLQKAAELYDYSKGYRFSTYASRWIKDSILGLINNGTHWRLRELRKKVTEFEEEHRKKNNQDPALEEISQALNLPLDKVEEARCSPLVLTESAFTIRRHRSLIEIAAERAARPDNPKTSSPFDLLAGKETEKLENKIIAYINLNNRAAPRQRGGLTAQETKVLSRRFGLERDEQQTVPDIAAGMGLKNDRVYYLIKASLKKLRALLAEEGFTREDFLELAN